MIGHTDRSALVAECHRAVAAATADPAECLAFMATHSPFGGYITQADAATAMRLGFLPPWNFDLRSPLR